MYLLASAGGQGELPIVLFLTELIIVAAVAVVVKYVRLPYTIALVSAGLGIGLLRAQHYLDIDFKLTPELVFTIFLPILLFEAALNLHVHQLRANVKPIALLAVLGVLLASLGVGYGLSAWAGIPIEIALVFGALISATDPISVLAIFKELRAPARLSVLVEGESLLNDGAAVVIFHILLGLALGDEFSAVGSIARFLYVSVGGLLLGTALGVLISHINAMVDDHLIEITLSTILAYGSYLAAEHGGLSGVMAVIAAGLVYGNLGAKIGMSPNTRVMMKGFWDYAGFLMNSLVFLLIGTQVDLRLLASRWELVLSAFVVVLVSRAAVVFALAPIGAALDRRPIPLPWLATMVWSGLRGSISMALVLGLPADLPWRDDLILMTFGVVVLSLFLQGLTIGPLLSHLGITVTSPGVAEYERVLGNLLVHERARSELNRLRGRYHITEDVCQELLRPHDEAKADLEKELHRMEQSDVEIRAEQLRDARRNILTAQVATLHDAHSRGLLSDNVLEELLSKLAEQQLATISPPKPDGGSPATEVD